MGTPEFAVKALERLYIDGHDIVCVFTQEDKPRNRGMKMSFSPVKELALLHGTPVHQPKSLRDGSALDLINDLCCDLIAVVAYGKLLSKEILDLPPLGCINIHGSILPKYRGAAPIQHAIINGEKETGVTSMYMSEEMDTGDMLFFKKTNIGENDTSADLYERLSLLGAQLLSETIDAIDRGAAKRIPQDNNDATYAPLLSKDMSPIDWTKSAHEIKCRVRGLLPWPAATMELDGKTIKVLAVEISENCSGKTPGHILSCGKTGIEVSCSDGSVIITEVQAPGGKKMRAADYLMGNPIKSPEIKEGPALI